MFKTYEAFHKAYTEEYGRAIAYQEMMVMLDNAGAMATNIAKQINNPSKDFSLGTKDEDKSSTT